MSSYIPFTITSQGIFLTKSGETRFVSNDTPNFQKVKDSIKDGDWDNAWNASDTLKDLKEAIQGTDFQVVDGLVRVDGESLPYSLSKRILSFVEEKLPSKPLITFWRNLRQNPSFRARKALFDFLDQQGHPITEDGCFIAYKRVGTDFCSFHATPNGKHLSHKVGEHVEMPREDVDDDPSNTCSNGLHVANYNYAANCYYSGHGHLLDVKVNPRDVVAIPLDYNGQKMRVCSYDVVAIAEGERVNENLYKFNKEYEDEEDYEDDDYDDDEYEDEEDYDGYDFMMLDGVKVKNDLKEAKEIINLLTQKYSVDDNFHHYYSKGGRKGQKDLFDGNEFNIIRDRFESLDYSSIAGWICGYVKEYGDFLDKNDASGLFTNRP